MDPSQKVSESCKCFKEEVNDENIPVLKVEMIKHVVVSKHFLKFFVENQQKIFNDLQEKIKSGSSEAISGNPVYYFSFLQQARS